MRSHRLHVQREDAPLAGRAAPDQVAPDPQTKEPTVRLGYELQGHPAECDCPLCEQQLFARRMPDGPSKNMDDESKLARRTVHSGRR